MKKQMPSRTCVVSRLYPYAHASLPTQHLTLPVESKPLTGPLLCPPPSPFFHRRLSPLPIVLSRQLLLSQSVPTSPGIALALPHEGDVALHIRVDFLVFLVQRLFSERAPASPHCHRTRPTVRQSCPLPSTARMDIAGMRRSELD